MCFLRMIAHKAYERLENAFHAKFSKVGENLRLWDVEFLTKIQEEQNNAVQSSQDLV